MKNLLLPLAASAVVLSFPAAAAGAAFTVPLPTPREHYRTYDADKEALELLNKILQDLDPEWRARAMELLASGDGPAALPPVEPEEALETFRKLGLAKHKTEMLELFLHKSQVLDVIPEKHRAEYLPIVHDALLAFLDGLAEERLAERIIALSRIPQDAPRGRKILILASRLPALQKMGQIIARLEGIPPDISAALQTLESGIRTMSRDELVRFITTDVGRETIERLQIRFADDILAEASVGAVIRGSFLPPGAQERHDLVCKMIKPYVATGLPEEIRIIDALIDLATRHASFYRLEGMPLKDLFEDIKSKLADELRVTQEQKNFRRAYEYYRQYPRVRVPQIYDFSTPHATFMEFLHGEKISEAFPTEPRKRVMLARRLMDVMSYESLFSRQETSIFHGDPHAGNVMHIIGDSQDPFAIGLLDWGLLGEFDRRHRIGMVQLQLALRANDRKRLYRHVGVLLDGGLPADAAQQARIRALADECLPAKGGVYETYGDLVVRLMKAGFVLDPNLSLFIKSQVTLMGIYRELDPSLNPDRYLETRARNRVLQEFPKRLVLLPAWNYRGYRSLMSNGDVFAYVF